MYQGQKTLLTDVKARHASFRPPAPEPTKTLRHMAGEFGAGSSILKLNKATPIHILSAETLGQPLPATPAKDQEGDMSRGFKSLEPYLASTYSQLGRGHVGFIQPEYGVPDKHHHLSMPCMPKLYHKTAIPNPEHKKMEGDMSRGFAGPSHSFHTTYADLGQDGSFKSTAPRHDFAPLAEKQYRFAMATDRAAVTDSC
jgi:hypothetical protein